jgi:hypothetical protein
MKYLLILLLPFAFTCCNGQQQKKANEFKTSTKASIVGAMDYPKEIQQLGFEKLYDISKWYMYCIHCDGRMEDLYPALFWRVGDTAEHINSENPKLDSTTLGSLPLGFDNISIRGDTIEMHFYFYYKGYKVDEKLVESLPLWGTVFYGNSDTIRMYASRSEIRYFMKECVDYANCNVRESKPLQPEVIKYIKSNSKNLDPWFKSEAIRRGVIKE